MPWRWPIPERCVCWSHISKRSKLQCRHFYDRPRTVFPVTNKAEHTGWKANSEMLRVLVAVNTPAALAAAAAAAAAVPHPVLHAWKGLGGGGSCALKQKYQQPPPPPSPLRPPATTTLLGSSISTGGPPCGDRRPGKSGNRPPVKVSMFTLLVDGGFVVGVHCGYTSPADRSTMSISGPRRQKGGDVPRFE